jgi:hypothetical protein
MAVRSAWSLALALLAVIVLLGVPRRAQACSCIAPRQERVHLPSDGAVGVPVDVTLRVFLGAYSPALRARLATEYQLRDASGALVPLDATVVATRLDLRPRRRLRPSETYTLEHVFAFGRDGTRLTDTERLGASPGSTRGAFYPVVRFTTASGRAPARAPSVHVDRASLSFRQGGGDCGPGAAIAVEVSVAGAGPLDLLELRVRGLGVASTQPVGASTLYAGDLLCSPDPVTLPAGPSVTYEIALVDARGHELVVSPASTVSGGPFRRRAGRTLAQLAVPAGWPATIIPTPAAAAGSGPPGCEHGLEETARVELVAAGAPSAYADRPTLAFDGTSIWSLYVADPRDAAARTVRAFSLPASSSPMLHALHATTLAGWPEAMVTAGSRALVLARRYEEGGACHATLAGLELTSPGALRTAWETPFDASAGRYRMALGGDELAIVYGRRPEGQYSESLSFVFVDVRDGHETGAALHTAHGLDTNAEGAGLAYVGRAPTGGFVVVWPSGSGLVGRGPLRAASVSSRGLGTIVDLPIESYSPPDLVSAGDRAGLATATRDGRVELSTLAPDGTLVRGPIVLSRGVGGHDNRVPRLAWDGRRFAVLWETHPETGVHVVSATCSQGTTIVVRPSLAIAAAVSSISPAGVSALGITARTP